MSMKIKLVVATRLSEADFFTVTATGRSLAFNHPSFLELRLFPNNTQGLSTVYNQAIRESIDDPATLVFAHDDLLILDFLWYFRVKEALAKFDIVGVAGNRCRVPKQPSWAFIDASFKWDRFENLSALVGHGKAFPPSTLLCLGEIRQKVLLLDGLFLAVESKTLSSNNLLFDERFNFHFYDLDFCRQAEVKNISCGTWDISLVHQSGGAFGSEDWTRAYQKYLDKWGD